MKAMVLDAPAPIGSKPLRLGEISDPLPGRGELLVQVHVCAICRTDLHLIEGDLPLGRRPLVPGHQVVGTVERVGAGCDRFVAGDRVGIAWLRHTCGSCGFCLAGAENLCPGSLYTGFHSDGGYAEKATVPEAFAYRIPASFSDTDAAPLLCAGIIGYRALRRSEVPRRGRLGLFGFGSSAHLVLQIALHRGCEVFVATRGERHRALARSLGASWVGDGANRMPVLLDGAIVFAPAGEIVPYALRAIRSGGTVALAGITMTPLPPMDYVECLFHEKNLRSVEANTRADGEELLREAAEIPIRPRTVLYPLARANEALMGLKQGRIEGTGALVIGGDES